MDGADGSVEADRPPLLVDVMCGSLARHLRFCGYDAVYALDRGIEADERLLAVATAKERVLVTRDRDLAARAEGDAAVPGAMLLTERDVDGQLREVAAAGYPVALADEPRHCGACNGRLNREVDASDDSVDGDVLTDGDVHADRDDSDTRDVHADRDDQADRDVLPDYVPGDAAPVWRCCDCGRRFWKGSHWDDVAERIAEI